MLAADDARALVGGCSSLIDGVSADNKDSPFRMAGASRCPVRCVVSVEDVHGSMRVHRCPWLVERVASSGVRL